MSRAVDLDAVAAVAREHAEASEAGRRLAAPVVDALRDAGLFRLCLPGTVGGDQCSPAHVVDTIAAVAAGDGAAGWCLMIGATSGAVAAWLEPEVAAAIYGPPDVVSGGVFAPVGQVEETGDGVRLTGRWPWGSGSQHCDWLMLGCLVDNRHRLAFVPAAEVEVVDTWWSMGLRGTGSHDLAVDGAVVPHDRLAAITLPPTVEAPLYEFPVFGLLAVGVAAVGLGIARNSIDAFVALADSKVPSMTTRKLGDRPAAQAAVAQAEALLRGARALLDDAVGAAWDKALVGHAIPPAERASLRLAATSAARWSAEAVRTVHDAAGGTGVQERSSVLARCFRDAHTVTQHFMVAPPTYEAIGRVLLGGEDPSL